MTDTLPLGDRMKGYYEQSYKIVLPMRLPVIIRIDGRAFHTFTRGMDKPVDERFRESMLQVATKLCENVQNCQLAYIQSDEISLLLTPYSEIATQPWFGNELQKMVSIAASIATCEMVLLYDRDLAFDARAFVIPPDEVCNYFLWRQRDAERNSILGHAQSLYSQKQLNGKNKQEMMDMMFKKGMNWNDLPTIDKRGACIVPRWSAHREIPVFSEDREYIEHRLP